MRYIEFNPVRAAMCASPGEYRWSSYACNAAGEHKKLIRPHALYRALATTDKKRLHRYRELFRHHLDDELLHEMTAAWKTGTPLGIDRFKADVEAKLNLKVGQNRRGRPYNPADQVSEND